MRTLIKIFFFAVICVTARAQDIIILRSGEEIAARVEEVATDVIKYKKFDNLTGPTYNIEKSKVFMIRYENGSRDVFNEPTQARETTTASSSVRTGGAMPKSSFNINPLGLLQFGPILQYEGRMSSNSVIVPYFRYAYLGVLTHLIWTGFDEGTLSPATFGLGMGVKGFSEEVGNTMYYGGFLDFNVAKANYDVGEYYETQQKYSGLAVVSNFGYRWRKPSGSYINVGLFAGAAFTLKNEERYVMSGELYDTYSDTTIFAMLELSFGFGAKH